MAIDYSNAVGFDHQVTTDNVHAAIEACELRGTHWASVADCLGVLDEQEIESGLWYFRGERAGQYAFENARTGEWRYA